MFYDTAYTYEAVLFRDRYCDAQLVPTNQVRLTSYFWRFPLSETDTVWAPFDPYDENRTVEWAYSVMGKALCSTSIIGNSESEVPSVLELLRVAPNPFNPTIEIRYRLQKRAPIEIVVFDLQGRRVSTVRQSIDSEGEHLVTWPGRDERGREVGSGTYFVRVKAGRENVTTKITLIR